MKETSPLLQKEVKALGMAEMVTYALGYGANSFISLGFGTYLSYFWSDIAIIPLTAIATIIASSRLLDGITDIMIGFWVDRTENKYGKARPWLLWMALPGAISMSMLYYVPNFSPAGKIAYAFITYNMVAFFILTAMTIPLRSLVSLITDDQEKRLTLSMMGQMFGTGATVLGNMIVLPAIEALGGGKVGYFRFFSIISLVAMGMFLITFLGTRERVEPSQGKKEKVTLKDAIKLFLSNKWWILVTIFQIFSYLYPAFMSINMYYMTWIMKDPTLMGPFQSTIFISMLITLIVATPIVPKVGKINASFFAMATQMIGNLLPLFVTSVPTLMFSAVFRGAAPALLLGTGNAFLCDVVEYGEWKTGRRTEGLIFSGSSMGGKIGSGLGGMIVAFLLARAGYVGGAAAQTAQALNMITYIFTLCHAIPSLGCLTILFLLRKLDAQMPQIMADLETRRKSMAN
ncbi:MAG: hypothetical protein GX893_06660 [Firmicutes bacterium]|nr:hypothetical protein [Bacillota bacterium]